MRPRKLFPGTSINSIKSKSAASVLTTFVCLTVLGLTVLLVVLVSLPTPAAGQQSAQRRLDLYCDKKNQRLADKARYRNSRRRTTSSRRRKNDEGGANPLTFEECMDKLEAWCVRKERRRRRNRQPHRDCRALTEIRPDWNGNTNPVEKKRRDKQRRKTKQKKQQDRIKRRWKTVKPKKAQKVAIKDLNEKFARLALKQSMQADRMRGPGERRRKYPKRNPKAERAVTETEINDAGNYISADIDVTQEQFQDIVEEVNAEIEGRGRRKRKVGRGLYTLWPKDKSISYHYNSNVPQSTKVKIEDAIKLWQDNTCVRFQNQGPDTDRLEFVDGGGCSSYVGKVGGTQEVSIKTPGCDFIGIISHEIGHALGFFHEQARPDRDDSVQINMANVDVWYRNNFAKQYSKDVNNQKAPYDYGSVMHYAPYSFAQNSNTPTIFPVVGQEQYGTTMGQRQKPSFVDFQQINRAYCNHKCRSSNTVCEHDGYPDPNDCRRCKCPEGFGGDFCETVAFSNLCPGSGVLEAYRNPQIIKTPNYPGRFSRGTECIYLIKTLPGRRVFLQFEGRFDLHCKDVCDSNYLEIKNSTSFQRTGGRFCCGFKPQDDPISSEGSEMLLIMRNYGNHQQRGFSARYWTDARRTGGTGVTIVAPATTRRTTTTGTKTTTTTTTLPTTTTTTSTTTTTTSTTPTTTTTTTTPTTTTTTTTATTTTTFTISTTTTLPPTITTTARPTVRMTTEGEGEIEKEWEGEGEGEEEGDVENEEEEKWEGEGEGEEEWKGGLNETDDENEGEGEDDGWIDEGGDFGEWSEVTGTGDEGPEENGEGDKWPDENAEGDEWPDENGEGDEWPDENGDGDEWPEENGEGDEWPEENGEGDEWPDEIGEGDEWPDENGEGDEWPDENGEAAPRFTTAIPTGVNVRGCNCREWSQWTRCSAPCGGCGKINRKRRCSGRDPKKCYTKEERTCNRQACTCDNLNRLNRRNRQQCQGINPDGISLHWKYGVLNKGCCFAAPMERDGKCGPFNIGTLFSIFGGGQDFNIGNIVGGGGGAGGSSGGGGIGNFINSFIGG